MFWTTQNDWANQQRHLQAQQAQRNNQSTAYEQARQQQNMFSFGNLTFNRRTVYYNEPGEVVTFGLGSPAVFRSPTIDDMGPIAWLKRRVSEMCWTPTVEVV